MHAHYIMVESQSHLGSKAQNIFKLLILETKHLKLLQSCQHESSQTHAPNRYVAIRGDTWQSGIKVIKGQVTLHAQDKHNRAPPHTSILYPQNYKLHTIYLLNGIA